MRRIRILWRRSGLVCVVGLTALWFLTQSIGLQLAFTERLFNASTTPDYVLEEEEIPPECLCHDNETGRDHDFCYHLPENRSHYGQRFSCQLISAARSLGLLERSAFVRLEKSRIPDPVFVTGASDSHFTEEKRMIKTVQDNFPLQTIVFYDLGLNEANRKAIQAVCQVEYREVGWSRFPAHVRNLMEYRWKPIIIADALREFGAVWWMDSSVVWKKKDLSHVYRLLECRSKSEAERRLLFNNSMHSGGRLGKDDIESGWHIPEWTESVRRCDKFAYLLQGFTGHGIFPATHPKVYDYIPTNENGLKRSTAKMYEAGFAFAVRTVEVVQDVVKWYALCALEKECMAPRGSSLGCRWSGADRYHNYASCHRFDQSVVNLLLANRNHYDRYYYTSGIVDFFNIVRGAGGVEPKTCPKEPIGI